MKEELSSKMSNIDDDDESWFTTALAAISNTVSSIVAPKRHMLASMNQLSAASVATLVPTYVKGPLLSAYLQHPSLPHKFALFGENHSQEGGCSSVHQTFVGFLTRNVMKSPCVFDVFVEMTMPSWAQAEFAFPQRHPVKEVIKEFTPCFLVKDNTGCGVARYHYVDIRHVEGTQLLYFYTAMIDIIYGRTPSEDIDVDAVIEDLQSGFVTDKILKQLLHIPYPKLRGYLTRYFNDKVEDLIEEIDGLTIRLMTAEQANIVVSKMLFIVDVYTLSRSLRTFEDGSDPPTRNVILSGTDHVIEMIDMLSDVGFEIVHFSESDSGCIQVPSDIIWDGDGEFQLP